MLVPQHASFEDEYNRLLHRVGESYADVLELSHIHKVATGLISADYDSLRNYDTHDLNDRDSQGRTALHWAALRANLPILRLLLRARVEIEATDNEGKTALHFATMSRSQRCIELLLLAGANVFAKDHIGYQPLHWTVSCQNDIETLETFLMAGADVRTRTHHGTTALQLASLYDHPDHARALLAAGADIDAQDNDGDSSLFDAIHIDRQEIVELLLSHGASIEDENKNGHTILHILALWGSVSTIAPFMSYDLERLDSSKRDKSGQTAWEALQDRSTPDGFKETFEALLARCLGGQSNESLGVKRAELEG